ncbi:MAG TPA: SpoIIE family protein phosphatase [Bacteroidia bacterium]|nr:SpoIIE family protein phosphatase [Bacteroidia bacterium]
MNKLKNWFIGDYLAKTDDVFERSKIELLYHYSISFILLGTAFYVSAIIRGYTYHVFVLSFAVLALSLIPFILKYKQSVKLASIWYITQQIIVSNCELMIQQNIPDITSGLWIMTFVLFSFFLFERKWGLILIFLMQVIAGVCGTISLSFNIPESQKYQGSIIEILVPFLLNIIIVWMFIKTRKEAEGYIQEQSEQLSSKSKELETKNNDITDSINYAKRIQLAVLPNEETIQRNIPLYFIYYRPKAIVSGDFYWFHAIDMDSYIYVNADCTGHGVPGAFMTVIASNLLNQTVIDNKIYQPSLILQEVDRLLSMTLKQDSERFHNVQDGMDLTLVKVNKAKREVVITSAKRPVVYIRNKQFLEIKANKFSIGGMRTETKVFEEVKIECQQDDMMYLFTDGYHDQFGGPKGKKYSSKKLKEKFMEIHMKGISEQKAELDAAMRSWKGDLEQIDDICVTGIRF